MIHEDLRKAFTLDEHNRGAVRIRDRAFTESEFIAALSGLSISGRFRCLDLSDTSVGNAGMAALIRAVPADGFPELRKLILARTTISDGEIGNFISVAGTHGFLSLSILDLSNCAVGIESIQALTRSAQGQGLPRLKCLILRKTNIGDEGIKAIASVAGIHGLPCLRVLDLATTQASNIGIKALAYAIGVHGLPQLRSLFLDNTQVGDEEIKVLTTLSRAQSLPQLQRLSLNRTMIGDIGAAALAHLAVTQGMPQLRELSLNNTRIGNEGVKKLAWAAEAQGLPKLSALLLRGTLVDNEGISALAQAAEAEMLKHFRVLHLGGTRVTVATEELATGDPIRIFNALNGVAVSEAKVVVVGEPGVGKSWLCQRLFMNRVPCHREETHDIELIRSAWNPPVEGQSVSLKIWDFGGQHILHGIHEMFLSSRSVAILVLDGTRSLTANKVEYWQKLICHCCGRQTPTIIVITKCDDESCSTKLRGVNAKELQYGLAIAPRIINKFSSIAPLGHGEVSEPLAINSLRAAISEVVQQMGGIRQTVSIETARMKKRVEKEIVERDLITIAEYDQWCQSEGICDQDHSILRALHNFGSVHFFGKTEQEREPGDAYLDRLSPAEERLRTLPRDYILDGWIANPRWLKWPIYEVIRRAAASSYRPGGTLTRAEMVRCVQNGSSRYKLRSESPQSSNYVCRVMELNGLSGELPDGVLLIPSSLPDGKPYRAEEWKETRWWEWEFLPEHAFHRFILRMHMRREVVKDEDGIWQHWRRAVVIKYDSNIRAGIFVVPEKGRIEARLEPASQQPERFNVLCEVIRDLFENEILRCKADRKYNSSLPEFAAPVDIRQAIEDILGKCPANVPNLSQFGRWAKKYKMRLQANQIDVRQLLDQYKKFYAAKQGQPLEDIDLYDIEERLKRIFKEKTKP